MARTIYEILAQDIGDDEVAQSAFIKAIDSVKNTINNMDSIYGTPIMYYCRKHLNSGVSPIVLNTLITRFKADVNLSSNNYIPLSILLMHNASDDIIEKNIDSIILLLQYTDIKSLVRDYNPSLFAYIMNSPILVRNDEIVPRIIEHLQAQTTPNPKHNIIPIEDLGKLYNQLAEYIIDINDELHIRSMQYARNTVFQIIQSTPLKSKLPINFISPETLFLQAIEHNNLVLADVIVQDHSNDINPIINAIKIQFQHDNDAMEKAFNPLISYVHMNAKVILCNELVYIPARNIENIRDPLYRILQSLGASILSLYLQNHDAVTASKKLGFKNNLLHFFALSPQYDKTTIDAVYAIYNDASILMAENAFGQTPLKIALLSGNINFISFFEKQFSHDTPLTTLDRYGNTVGHNLARASLSQQQLQDILKILKVNIQFILNTKNELQHTPIFDAISIPNKVFIEWWCKQGGSLKDVNKHGNTLLHHLAQNFNAVDSVTPGILSKIFQEWSNQFTDLINIENNQGMTPVEVAIASHNSAMLKLLLDNYYMHINWDHHNIKSGQTIATVMANAFVNNKYYNSPYLKQDVEIVKLLIKYEDNIKELFYKTTPTSDRTPIKIIESKINMPFIYWIHHIVSRSILVSAKKMMNKMLPDDDAMSQFTAASGISTGPVFTQKYSANSYRDNYVVSFSKDVILKANQVPTQSLPQKIHDIIYSLSFFIVHSNLNACRDKLAHIMLSHEMLELNPDKTLIHIINMLDPQLRLRIYQTPNILGQYILHIAIQANYPSIIEHGLSLSFDLINQKTKVADDIQIDLIMALVKERLIEKFVTPETIIPIVKVLYSDFSLADYVIMFKRDKIMDQLFSLLLQHNKHGNQLCLQTKLSYDRDPHDLIEYAAVQQPIYTRLNDVIKSYKDMLQKRVNIIREYNQYQPIMPGNIMELLKTSSNTLYLGEFYTIIEPAALAYKLNPNLNIFLNQKRIMGFIFAYRGHAYVMVLFKDKSNMYHAFLQDSAYAADSPVYLRRRDEIKKILFQTLKIDNADIHELKVNQQNYPEMNCGLWAVANIQTIMSMLVTVRQYSCFRSRDLENQFSVKAYLSKNIVDKIKLALTTKAVVLQKVLKNTLLEYHGAQYIGLHEALFYTSYAINEEVLEPIDITPLVNELGIEDNAYETAQLSDNTISRIISEQYTEHDFSIYPNADYNNASHERSLVILPDLSNSFMQGALRQQVDDFMQISEDHTVARLTRTYIINQDQNHWVVLVITARKKGNRRIYDVYFADSLNPQKIPDLILKVLNTHTALKAKIHNISVLQQGDSYNCGLWAIVNTVEINAMLYDESTHHTTVHMKYKLLNILNTNYASYFMRLRKQFCDDLRRDITEEAASRKESVKGQLNNLLTEELELEIMPAKSSCTASVPLGIDRKKRGICDDNRSSDHEPIKMLHHPLEEHLTPDVKIQVQMCRNIAFLLSLKDLIRDDQSTKLENFMNYIRNIGDIVYEGIDNQSDREKQILEEHYNDAQDFLSVFSKDKLLMLVQEPTQDLPLLFDNGQHSLIVYYEHGRYKLYSQNYHYQYIFEVAKASVTFDDIKSFADVFFAWCSGYSAEYTIYTLTNEASALNVVTQLEKMNIWNPKAIVPDALKLHERTIEGILITTIKKLFFVNNKVPELIMLKDGKFFVNNHESMSVRLDKLHKALMYDVNQEQKIINVIRSYRLKTDETYLNHIPPNDREISKIYCSKVVSKLNSPGGLTVQDLSEISWQVLKESMETKDIDLTPQLRASVIKTYQAWYQNVARHMHTLGTITQPLCFLPDMIRAYNNHEYAPLVKIGGIIIMDITTNKLQNGLINQLSSVISADRFKVIHKYAKINNLVMKALTIYSIYELYEQTKILQPESTEYKIIQHHLSETEATLALITLEPFIPEVAPFLWLGLTIEQLWYSGKEINIQYHLNLSAIKSIILSLGFQQDELSRLIEESYCFAKNLEGLSTINTMYQGLNIIRVPQVSTTQWKTIESNKIPSNIKDALNEKHDNAKCIYKVDTHRNQCISEVDGFRVIAHYNVTQQGNVLGMLYVNSSYEIAYYDVYRSNPLIVLKLNYVSSYNAIWVEEREYSNITWRRIDNPLNHISNQDISIYYNKYIIPIASVPSSLLYTQFDAREGNMYIQCTSEWLDLAIQKYSKYNMGAVFTVYISYKDYPSSLIFNQNITTSSSTHPIFSLYDQSGKLQTRYIIADDNAYYNITDNTKIISIICAQPNIYTINSIDEYMQIGNANVSIADKYQIQLYCNTCLIGTLHNLAASHVVMHNVLGLINSSYILLGKDNISFDITLRGNINIYHADSNLTVVGLPPHTYSSQVFCRYQHHKKINYNSYNIIIPNMIEIFKSVKISRSIQGRDITFVNSMMQLAWNTQISNVSLIVTQSTGGDLLQSLNSMDVLSIDNKQTTYAYTKQFIHYVDNIELSEDLVLKKIYHNSTNNSHKILDEFQNLIVGMDQMSSLFICNITKNFMHDRVLLFEDDAKNEYYHILPNGIVNITINSITYHTTRERVCTVYPDHIHETGRQFQYIDSSDGNHLKTIGICFDTSLLNSSITSDNNIVINGLAIKYLPQDTYLYFSDQKVQYTNVLNTYASKIVDQVLSDSYDNDNMQELKDTLLNPHINHGVIIMQNVVPVHDTVKQHFIQSLQQMYCGIHTLDLSNQHFLFHIKPLLSVLVGIPTLKVLILHNCSINGKALISLLETLPQMNLNTLDLSDNNDLINDDIGQLLIYKCPFAQHTVEIYITYAHFDSSALSFAPDCKYIKIINKASIEYTAESVNPQPMITINLRNNQTVQSIVHKLNQCSDSPYDILLAGTKYLDVNYLITLLSIRQCCTIRVLDLSYNAIIAGHMNDLIKVLPKIHGLEVLKLSSCNIDNKLMYHLLDILPSIKLRELDISNNEINDQGIANLASRECPVLSQSITINISGNKADVTTLSLLQEARNVGCDYMKIIDGIYVKSADADIARTVRHIKSSDIATSHLSSTTVDNTSTHGQNRYETTIMTHHKHRHHHGEQYELGTQYNLGQKHIAACNREPRDIEDEFEKTEDNIDTVLDAQDDIHDSNVRLAHPDINVRTLERESNQFISNKVSKDINSEDQSTTDNSADILEWKNDISSAGDRLKPIGYNMIRTVWGYLNVFQWTKKTKDTSGNISNKLSQNILSDHIDSITDQYTINMPNSLKIGHDNSNNSSIQEVTHTFDTHSNLILAQLLTHKLFGHNKLLNAMNYIAPEQAHNIKINKMADEILPILLKNNVANNTNYNSHDNTAPQWYKDLFQDGCEAIMSENDDRVNSENIYTNNLPETILGDSIDLFAEVRMGPEPCYENSRTK